MKNIQWFILLMLLVLLMAACDSNPDQNNNTETTAEILIEDPNEPIDMQTIKRETKEYQSMKKSEKKEKQLDMILIDKEKLSNKAP